MQASDPEIAFTIQLMIARTLSVKLREARLSQQKAVEKQKELEKKAAEKALLEYKSSSCPEDDDWRTWGK